MIWRGNLAGDSMIRSTPLATIAFSMLVSWTPLAAAQALGAPTIEPPLLVSSYSDAQLKSFAVAALNVHRIRDLYLPELEAAGTLAQEQVIRKAATDEMVGAVEREGLTVEQFREISIQMERSPELARRVEEHAREAAGK